MESTGEEAMDLSPIELLPTEILQKILSYLPVRDRVRVERVCKRWKNVSTERVWRDKQVLIIASSSNKNYMQFFHPLKVSNKSSKFDTMKDNKLYIGFEELGIIQSLVSRAGQHIEKLIFNPELHQGARALSIIATYCHNIENIRLDCIFGCNTEVFLWLVRSNERLHSISSCSVAKCIEILPLKDWKSLDIGVPPSSQIDEWEEKAIALIENSPSLEKFRACYWTPRILTAISNCQQLKKIDFPIYDKIAANALILDISLLNRLTCLEVNIHGQYHGELIVKVLRHCIKLENLYLQFLNCELPPAVEEAVLAHPKLECLKLSSSKLTDETLIRLLKFKYLRLMNGRYPFTEDGLFEMIVNSERLEKLEIPDMIVSMEFFEGLAQNTRKCRKILNITVNCSIYEEALAICEGSRILITTELHWFESDIENWLS